MFHGALEGDDAGHQHEELEAMPGYAEGASSGRAAARQEDIRAKIQKKEVNM